jgi:hypothetical protein
MGRKWIDDKSWADRYWPDIERVIRRVAGEIIDVAPTEPDEDRAGRDYTVTCGGIAARIRRPNVWQRDVTIRSSRRSGVATELQKWIAGEADWLVYGWTDEKTVPEWVVVSIPRLIARGLHRNRNEIPNRDGETSFIAIPVTDIIAAGLLVDGELRYPTTVVKRGSVHPVVRCPKCRSRAYEAGPNGLPQRRCWQCGWIWIAETPNAGQSRAQPTTLSPTDRQRILEDPTIKAALEKLDGTIVSIRPIRERPGREGSDEDGADSRDESPG